MSIALTPAVCSGAGEGHEGAGRAGVGPALPEVGDEPPAAGGTLQEEAAAEGEALTSHPVNLTGSAVVKSSD